MTITKMSSEAAKALLEEKKPPKYGNIKVWYDGQQFDSKGELERWKDLKLLEAAGEISHLERQKKYAIAVHGVHICDYVADFTYIERGVGPITEDFKSAGTRTPTYRLKKKLMWAVLRIGIRETEGKR